MNLETKITIYKFTPQVFTLTQKPYCSLVFFKYKIDIKVYFSYYEYLTFYHLYIIAVNCFDGVGIY